MLGINVLLLLIFGYFLILTGGIWMKWKRNLAGKGMILILTFRNSGASVEGIIWDLIRLKSWDYQGLSFMISGEKSDDDTLAILKVLQKRHQFLLVNSFLSKRFAGIMGLEGRKVLFLNVEGSEPPSLVRKKMVSILNKHHDQLAG